MKKMNGSAHRSPIEREFVFKVVKRMRRQGKLFGKKTRQDNGNRCCKSAVGRLSLRRIFITM